MIAGYHTIRSGYEVTGGEIRLRRVPLCDPESAGPCYTVRPLMYVEYRPQARKEAQTIWRIARARMPNANVKLFETTTLDSHLPDARIMLIPKAGA